LQPYLHSHRKGSLQEQAHTYKTAVASYCECTSGADLVPRLDVESLLETLNPKRDFAIEPHGGSGAVVDSLSRDKPSRLGSLPVGSSIDGYTTRVKLALIKMCPAPGHLAIAAAEDACADSEARTANQGKQ